MVDRLDHQKVPLCDRYIEEMSIVVEFVCASYKKVRSCITFWSRKSVDPPELLARLQLCLLLQQFCLHCRAGVCLDILHPSHHERYLDRVHRLSEHCRHISEDSHTA